MSGQQRFQWQPTGPLPNGAAYEVVIWNRGENPSLARGIAQATLATSASLDVDVLYETGQFGDGTLNWTVLVVQKEPYVRLTQPASSPQRTLIYAPPS